MKVGQVELVSLGDESESTALVGCEIELSNDCQVEWVQVASSDVESEMQHRRGLQQLFDERGERQADLTRRLKPEMAQRQSCGEVWQQRSRVEFAVEEAE